MKERMLVVDRELRAVSIDDMIDNPALAIAGRRPRPVPPPPPAGGELPLLGDRDRLVPGGTYPSTHAAGLQWVLPSFRLGRDAAVVLLLLEPSSVRAQEGVVWQLTVGLAWDPPAGPPPPREIDATVDLRLRWRVPVDGGGSVEETLALQAPRRTGPRTWESVTPNGDVRLFDAVYAAMRDVANPPTLIVRSRAKVAVRTWRQIVIGRASAVDQLTALGESKALFTDLVAAKNLKNLKVREVGAATKVATSEDEGARAVVAEARGIVGRVERIDARPIAADRPFRGGVVGRMGGRLAMSRVMRAMPRPVVGRVEPSTPAPSPPAPRPAAPGPSVAVRPEMLHRVSPLRMPAAMRRRVDDREDSPIVDRRTHDTPVQPDRPSRPVTPRIPVTVPPVTVPPVTVTPRAPVTAIRTKKLVKAMARVHAPPLATAVAAAKMEIDAKKVVPTRAVLDAKGQPALLETTMIAEQQIPFAFDPDQHPTVYQAPGHVPGAIPRLVRRELDDGGVWYQDNNRREVAYVRPSEFRLARPDRDPYLPPLTMVASSFSTAEQDGQATVVFRVILSYRLTPWVDGRVREQIRAQLAAQGLTAELHALVPGGSKLELDVLGTPTPQPDARFDTELKSIEDTLELSHEQFVRLWREQLAGPGLSGRVTLTLFDGQVVAVPVRLAFTDPSLVSTECTRLGAVDGAPGDHRVRVRNRIESPVRIRDFRPVPFGAGTAVAVDEGTIGQTLAPLATTEVIYRVDAPEDGEPDFSSAVEVDVLPDHAALLRRLLISAGYTSVGHDVEVRARAGTFAPPTDGSEPLTGLLVEFDDGTVTTLTPEDPEEDVELVGRLADVLLGRDDDRNRFFYRVTNLHHDAEGARTSWLEATGGQPLEVGRANVQLDF